MLTNKLAPLAAFAAVCMLAAPVQAASGDMSVATFLLKADRLRAKGPLALVSGDISVLKGEVMGSAAIYRKQIRADKAAGRSPHSCPPDKPDVSSDYLLTHFRSYPESMRARVSVRQGFYDMMKKRYPCG